MNRSKVRLRLVSFAVAILAAAGVLTLAAPAMPARAAFTLPMRVMISYPWQRETAHTTDRYPPSIGTAYNHDNQTVLALDVTAMKTNGMDATVVSWWGQGQHNEQVRFPNLYMTAAVAHLGVIPYYEKEGYGDPSDAALIDDLNYLRNRINANPGSAVWLDGKPVIWVYNALGGCERVTKWKRVTAAAGGWYFVMKVFPGYASCPDQPSSWHQYGPAKDEQAHLPYSFSISPGFWRYDETSPRLPRDLNRWRTNVTHMLASGAQWQSVVSLDEFGEGTNTFPSSVAGWNSSTGWGPLLDELGRQIVGVPPAPSPTGSPTASPSGSPTVSPTGSPSPSPTVTTVPPSPTPTVSPTGSPTLSPTASPSPSPTVGPLPIPDHIVVAIFENHSNTQIIGNSSAPWFNAQLSHGAYLSSSVAITHPSLPNYLALWSGSTQGVTDDSCSYTFSTASLGQQLAAAGLLWKGYAENLPSAGSTVCTASGGYAKKHAPWAYWPTDAAGGTPYTAWPADFTQLPKLSFVIPNLCDDMHDCSVATGDAWAMAHLDPYRQWAMTHNSVLITTFDENDGSSGNRIYTVFEGEHVMVGTFSEAVNHYRVLRTIEAMCGLPGIGAAAATTPITDIWN